MLNINTVNILKNKYIAKWENKTNLMFQKERLSRFDVYSVEFTTHDLFSIFTFFT